MKTGKLETMNAPGDQPGAFTLIELLVGHRHYRNPGGFVTASSGESQNKAKRIECVSNAKQWVWLARSTPQIAAMCCLVMGFVV